MQEAACRKLKLLQDWERVWMTSLLQKNQDPFTLVGAMSAQQISDKVQEQRYRIPRGVGEALCKVLASFERNEKAYAQCMKVEF